MLHTPAAFIAYASQYFTLNTGDLLFTGTPKGVGSIAIGDNLVGSVNGEVLLKCAIK
jgi:acylpyruvate hydrolase